MEEILLFVLMVLGLQSGLGGVRGGSDLVSFLPTDTYLQSRRIPVNVENLLDLATAEPKDGKAQILQLVALRALAEKPELSKKDPAAVRRALEKVARGEIARDRFGFSQDYARRTLIALGGKAPPAKAAPQADLRAEALGWFPASVTLVGFASGSDADAVGAGSARLRQLFAKAVGRPRDFDGFFRVVEKIGNIRMDRLGFAYAADKKGGGKDRLYARFTGKLDRQRVVAALKSPEVGPGLQWTESKDAKGTPISTLQANNFGFPAVAFIGDTDILLGAYVVTRDQADKRPITWSCSSSCSPCVPARKSRR
jgi:hypothetical protein